MNESFFDKLEKRLKLPITFDAFIERFRRDRSEINPKVKERKVYYSSARKKKNIEADDYFE